MLRKNIYKWHRTLSLIIALPVLLWATSGLMHPIMTSFKPNVKNQALLPVIIDSFAVKVPLNIALEKNNIPQIQNFRIIKMAGEYYYQVQVNNDPVLRYYSCRTGDSLKSGDTRYAEHLATEFLGDAKVSVTGTTLITSFGGQYRDINRLLPVYKVTFNRNDGIILYVDNASDRFGLATDNFRNGFQQFFTLVHTWEWLAFLGKGKLIVEILFALLAFLTSLMGLYIFFITKKPTNASSTGKHRRRHRVTSLVAVTFTLLFTFSGAYHAFVKLEPVDQHDQVALPSFAAADLRLDVNAIEAKLGEKSAIHGISLVRINDKNYWRIVQTDFENRQVKEECCVKPAMLVAAVGKEKPGKAGISYIHTAGNSILPDGEKLYAQYLANTFSGNKDADIQSITLVTKFTEEYGFINKRLPVIKVSYHKNDNERYYVETATGKLSTVVQDKDVYEGYSFALLHKHHFMDWAGKQARDITTMLGAALNIAAVLVGIILYIRVKRRKR
jgi:hypothetical protein